MRRSITVAWALLALAPSAVGAETVEASQSESASNARLKLEFVITTVRGGVDVEGSPFSMHVSANGEVAEMRIGTEVPVPVTSFVEATGNEEGIPGIPVTSFQYRNVGTNVTVSASSHEEGFRLRVSLEQSTIQGNQRIAGIDLPRFRTFRYNHHFVLRDGETVELARAPDSELGETRRARIILSVVP